MKFYEAIELGNTLIGENHSAYYDSDTNCGCALGSAMAAIGKDLNSMQFGVFHGFQAATIEAWPWTGLPVSDFPELWAVSTENGRSLTEYSNNTVAMAVSHIHCALGVPRMKIAKMLKPIEDALEAKSIQPPSEAKAARRQSEGVA